MKKTLIKVLLMIVVVLVLFLVVRTRFSFNIANSLKNFFGGTELNSVTVNVGQEFVIPVFEIVSLEIFYPQNLSMIEANKSEWWRLNIGTVYILMEYDTYIKLGVRNPDSIKIERIDDTVYVDESTIVIELIDIKLNNFKHIRTFTSNVFVINNDSEEFLFHALNEIEKELTEKIVGNSKANFDAAKRNFMENYKNLCNAMGLEVVWR